MLNRDLYYTQTEACKAFKMSPKRFKQIINDNGLKVIKRPITLHTVPEGKPYMVSAVYVLKTRFQQFMDENK